MSHQSTIAISWQSPEYVRNNRTADWYWTVWVITVLLVAGLVYLHNYLFAVVIILSSVIITLFASRDPRMYTVEVSSVGIQIGPTFYSYQNIDAFWIADIEGEGKKLIIHSDSAFMPISVIPLPETVDTAQLRTALADNIDERELVEPILVRLFEKIF